MNWSELFSFDIPLLEIIIRGTAMYWALVILLRVVLKRQAGELGMTDLLLITLLADASQNGMAGDYKSIPDGIILVATLIAWNFIFDWLNYHSKFFHRLIEPKPLPLIIQGKPLHKNMRREYITLSELKEQLREQGIDNMNQVKKAVMESDGQISVIEYENQHHEPIKRTER